MCRNPEVRTLLAPMRGVLEVVKEERAGWEDGQDPDTAGLPRTQESLTKDNFLLQGHLERCHNLVITRVWGVGCGG